MHFIQRGLNSDDPAVAFYLKLAMKPILNQDVIECVCVCVCGCVGAWVCVCACDCVQREYISVNLN